MSRRPGEDLGGYIQADYELEFDSSFFNAAMDIPGDFGNFRVAVTA